MEELESLLDNSICPSFRCEDGALLLGIRQESGIVAILPKALPIDESFIANAKENDVLPERRFRFAGKCVKSGCHNWNKNGCGVAIRLMHFLEQETFLEPIPDCSIRKECRWFKQEGDNICKICPKLVTEITAEEVDQYFNSEIHKYRKPYEHK